MNQRSLCNCPIISNKRKISHICILQIISGNVREYPFWFRSFPRNVRENGQQEPTKYAYNPPNLYHLTHFWGIIARFSQNILLLASIIQHFTLTLNSSLFTPIQKLRFWWRVKKRGPRPGWSQPPQHQGYEKVNSHFMRSMPCGDGALLAKKCPGVLRPRFSTPVS